MVERPSADVERYLNFATARAGYREHVADGRTWVRDADGRWRAKVPMVREPEPDRRTMDRVLSVGAMASKARADAPSWDDLKQDRVIGKHLTVVERADGNKEGQLVGLDAEAKRRLMEMDLESIGVQSEISERMSADVEFVEMRGEQGVRHVAADRVDTVARRTGMRVNRKVKAR